MIAKLSEKKLSKSHQKIADFISKNQDQIPFLTEEDIAVHCHVSIATVSRFWKAIDYQNFKDFKKWLKTESLATPELKMKIAYEKHDDSDVQRLMTASIHYLEQSAVTIESEHFYTVAKKLKEARKIYIFGSGSASCLSELLSFRLSRLGMDVQILPKSEHELFEYMMHMDSSATIVLFGFVQSSPEIRVLLDHACSTDIHTLLITDLMVSPMLQQADDSFYVERGERYEFHSMVAPIALIESFVLTIGRMSGEKGLEKLKNLHHLRK